MVGLGLGLGPRRAWCPRTLAGTPAVRRRGGLSEAPRVCAGPGGPAFRGQPVAQVRSVASLPFSALIACLMVAMTAVYVTQQGAGSKRRKGRSTERLD